MALLLLAAPPFAAAQEEAPPEPATITVDEVSTLLDTVDTVDGLTEEEREALRQVYAEAQSFAKLTLQYAAEAAAFAQQTAEAPERAEEMKARLEQPAEQLAPEVGEEATLQELEAGLSQAEALLAAAQTKLTELEGEPENRGKRRQEVPNLLAKARQDLAVLLAEEAPAEEAGENPRLIEARRLRQRAQEQALEQEIAKLEQELLSYEARGELLTLRLQEATRERNRLQGLVEEWRALVMQRRQEQAREAEAEARAALLNVENVAPRLRPYAAEVAAENAALVEERTGAEGVMADQQEALEDLDTVDETLDRLGNDFTETQQKLDAAGLTHATGLLLREQQSLIPELREHKRNLRRREQQLGEVQLEIIQLRKERMALLDLPTVIEEVLEEIAPAADEETREELAAQLRPYLEAKRRNLTELQEAYDDYWNVLLKLDNAERALVTQAELFDLYIEEQVLWVRSGNVFGPEEVRSGWNAALLLVDYERWRLAAFALGRTILRHPAWPLFVVALLLGLTAFQRRERQLLAAAGKEAASTRCISYRYTLRALVITTLLALPLPLLMWTVGWLLSISEFALTFGSTAGEALMRTAYALFLFEFLRHLCRPHGLLQGHFAWPAAPLRSMKRMALAAEVLLAPAVFIIIFFDGYGDELYKESLGRLSYLFMMVVLLVIVWRVLRPSGGALQQVADYKLAERRKSSPRMWFIIGIGILGLLLAIAFLGYYYTAWRLTTKLFTSAWVVLLFGLLYGLILRWVLVAHRKLARKQARQRLAALKAKAAGDMDAEQTVEEETVDLKEVDEQTRRLVRGLLGVGLVLVAWFVWRDSMPALNFLNQIELTQRLQLDELDQTAGAEGVAPVAAVVAEGEAAVAVVEEESAITLGNIVVALLIGFITAMATRNLPGLMEIAILQRMNIGAGERYAAVTVARYIIIAIGAVIVFTTIGIGWSKVQWLVAALGVGLGFGLQEIFANFISGIILLFERPVRVGDTVTIGGISGTVSRIRIRATSITDWDRKELIVPNKEFVTGQLVNWTLSDATLRVVVPVGVAYGSDTQKVYETLERIAYAHPIVLADPAPMVLFTGFGDSALDWELRVYCPSLDNFLKLRHDLLMAIDAAFHEEGIEIAFPQRDLHIRSFDAPLQMMRAREETADTSDQPKNTPSSGASAYEHASPQATGETPETDANEAADPDVE